MTSDIRIDVDRCIGSGNCAYWAPQVFDLDDDNLAVVVGDPTGQDDRVLLAAEHCPTAAISCRLDDGTQATPT